MTDQRQDADDDSPCCIACGQPIRAGDRVLCDDGGDYIHAACCGPEREAYVNEDGEPLAAGEPIPVGMIYEPHDPEAIERVLRKAFELGVNVGAKVGLDSFSDTLSALAERSEFQQIPTPEALRSIAGSVRSAGNLSFVLDGQTPSGVADLATAWRNAL